MRCINSIKDILFTYTLHIGEIMKISIIKKTVTIPEYIAIRLDEISNNTGYSQSNLVNQSLASFFQRFEESGTVENWMEMNGKSNKVIDYNDTVID